MPVAPAAEPGVPVTSRPPPSATKRSSTGRLPAISLNHSPGLAESAWGWTAMTTALNLLRYPHTSLPGPPVATV